MIIKYENTMNAIRNRGKAININIIAINKISIKLKMHSFKILRYT